MQWQIINCLNELLIAAPFAYSNRKNVTNDRNRMNIFFAYRFIPLIPWRVCYFASCLEMHDRQIILARYIDTILRQIYLLHVSACAVPITN